MQLIMLIGPSGSGKSTLAHELANHDETAVVLSADNVLEDFAYADEITYEEAYKNFYPKALDIVLQTAEEAFSRGQNVIWDQTNLRREDRAWRLDLVPDSYTKTAVYFEADFEACQANILNRVAAGGRHIPDSVLHTQLVDRCVPDYDEGFDKIIKQIVSVPEDDPEPCI